MMDMSDKSKINEANKPADLHELFTEHVLSFNLADMNRCILCADPPCSAACLQNAPVGSILESIYFENYFGALLKR